MSITGKRLQIYLELLRSEKPLGVREIQRRLGISTPSLVRYHLEYLEKADMVAKNDEGKYYAIKKKDSIISLFTVIGRALVPITTFFSVFTISFAVFIISLFWPPSLPEASLAFVCITSGLYMLYESYKIVSILKKELQK